MKPGVLLLAGPAGAGKSSIAARIAQQPNWERVSEDDYWVKVKRGRPAGELRTREEEGAVQRDALRDVAAILSRQMNVVIEFILYEDPPRPLLRYQEALAALDVPYAVRILRPNADELLRRIALRARPGDADLGKRRVEAEHQLRVLASAFIDKSWIIDASDMSLEDIYGAHFRPIIEGVLFTEARRAQE